MIEKYFQQNNKCFTSVTRMRKKNNAGNNKSGHDAWFKNYQDLVKIIFKLAL